MIKTLVSSFPYVSDSFDKYLESMTTLGVKNVEFYGCYPHCYLYDVDDNRIQTIKEKFIKANIKPVIFTPEQWDYQMSIALGEEKVRNRSIEYYKKAIKVAGAIGSEYVSIIAGYGYLNGNRDEDYSRFVSAMKDLLKVAKDNKVKILLENDTESCVSTAEELKKAIEDINDEDLSILLDVCELKACDGCIKKAFEALGQYIKYVQFSDMSSKGPRLIPGEGELNLAKMASFLKESNYDGYVGVELRGYTYMGNPQEATTKAINWLKENF